MMLFFDLDGPILNVCDRYYRAYNDSLASMDVRGLEPQDYWELKRAKVPDSEILRMTNAEHLLDKFKIKRNSLIEEKEYLMLDTVWPALRQTFAELFAKHDAVLVTLRTHEKKTLWQLDHLGIRHWFKTVISSPASGEHNVRWRIKVEHITLAGFAVKQADDESLFFGDTETDILAGRYLGMKTVGVSFGIRKKDLLLPLKPDLLFDTPVELSSYLKDKLL